MTFRLFESWERIKRAIQRGPQHANKADRDDAPPLGLEASGEGRSHDDAGDEVMEV